MFKLTAVAFGVAEQPQAVVRPELDIDDSVVEVGDLVYRAVRGNQEMLILSTVAILHRDQDVLPVGRGFQCRLADTRKLLTEYIPVLRRATAKCVIVDLLLKVCVLRGPLVALRIAGVIEPFAIAGPGHIAAGGRELHPGK